ncbi:hypothetical protein [Magnetospirillum sp. UT-4]|uniref:hypothetical protein n=1 Tax=Magnetospirillum sp. UT-4 TaxID=2681467 RepID=UPI001572C790|nr:hypothetical protein [Magnetospirillum sp. UT-4]
MLAPVADMFRNDDDDIVPVPLRSRRAERADRRRLRRAGYLDPLQFMEVVAGLGRREAKERLHIFSLSDFRKAAGAEKWNRLGGLVEVAVDQIIRRHIDPETDFYTRLDAETACVVLPRADRKVARTRVTTITRDIASHLFGNSVLAGRRPQVVVANVALSEVLGNRRAIRTAVAAAAPAAAPPPTEPAAAQDIHRVTLAKLLGEPEAAPAAAPYSISGGPRHGGDEPVWTVMHAEPRPRPAAETMPAEAEWIDAELTQRALAAEVGGAHLAPETSLTLVWTPTWVTSSSSIGAFHARVIRLDEEGGEALEGVNAYADASPVEALTLDRFVATQAARELTGIFVGSRRIGLTVPVHWTSLAPRWRDCIRIPFEECPATARRRFLKIEVFGLNPDISPGILHSLCNPLEGLGCDVMVRLPLSVPEMIGAMRGARAVGVDLAELPEEDRVGDDELFARLERFRDAARRARVPCYVWSVRRRAMIERLVDAGFSLVNGAGVMGDVAHPMVTRQ